MKVASNGVEHFTASQSHMFYGFLLAEFLYFFILPSRDDHYAIGHGRIIIM